MNSKVDLPAGRLNNGHRVERTASRLTGIFSVRVLTAGVRRDEDGFFVEVVSIPWVDAVVGKAAQSTLDALPPRPAGRAGLIAANVASGFLYRGAGRRTVVGRLATSPDDARILDGALVRRFEGDTPDWPPPINGEFDGRSYRDGVLVAVQCNECDEALARDLGQDPELVLTEHTQAHHAD